MGNYGTIIQENTNKIPLLIFEWMFFFWNSQIKAYHKEEYNSEINICKNETFRR